MDKIEGGRRKNFAADHNRLGHVTLHSRHSSPLPVIYAGLDSLPAGHHIRYSKSGCNQAADQGLNIGGRYPGYVPGLGITTLRHGLRDVIPIADPLFEGMGRRHPVAGTVEYQPVSRWGELPSLRLFST